MEGIIIDAANYYRGKETIDGVVSCWSNHTNKFYTVVHNGNKVMLIGDGV